mmetsp:Transcript_41111/g.41996  ORF Transcript_41111/g.41996 Transcript_41111/m.41996 type:complete len:295 (-) Transcript_41111:64-948(-)|eukprot:CAMPEP_0182419044 /NCGR_PEP_ID=MMETSP1167-20130531/3436_1 /TAXON_ID=2988 /ORGANISM="Mallomonas Sp, Strain CCMP3275" /LENGTH=294 /DNA_ID=CAMNT_0024593623 /DNA_START=61 /DNA_END=945 /DNA_ORIENTATION=-
MKLYITGGKSEKDLQIDGTCTVKDLKIAYEKISKKSIYRQSFKKTDGDKLVRLENESKSLKDYGIVDGDKLQFKDLGPQIGYRTVFLIEYAGPIVFVLLYAARPSFLYGSEKVPYHWVALLGIVCWTIHFLKREFETIFVHRFSRPTMPLSNLFKNSIYYWAFGAVIGYPLCHPKYIAPDELYVYIGLAIFSLSELGNLICHLMLRNLRPAEGSLERPIPKGFLFDFVSCPNYTCEVMSWVGFSIMTMIPFSYLFTLFGFAQMAEWALKKHNGYLKSYEGYKALRRKAIIPFVF